MNEIGGFFTGIGGGIAQNLGWLIVVGILLFAWSLLTTHGKGLIFTLAMVFIIVPIVVKWGPGIWTSAGIQGSDSAQVELCQRYGGGFCGTGAVAFSSGDQQTSFSSSSNQQVAAPLTSTTKTLKANALEIWMVGINPTPNDWLKNPSQSDLPKGVRCDVTGKSGFRSEAQDVWTWKCYNIDPSYNVESVTFTANSYWTKESRSWNISDPGGVANGSGSWETCSSCWDTVQSTPSPLPAAQNTLQNQAQAQNVTYTVTDATDGGAFWYEPVGGSCEGVSHTKSGVIPFGDPVTVAKEFPGAGWIKYLGSKDMILTGDGKCIYASTLK